jgi:hypothetical protein
VIYQPGSPEWYAYQAGVKQGLHQAAVRHLRIAVKPCVDCGQHLPACRCYDEEIQNAVLNTVS